MLDLFVKSHPELKITINKTLVPAADGYSQQLDNALSKNGTNAPDIYCVEADFVLRYTKGDMSDFAMPYEDLNIDVEKGIKDAEIADYIVDIGTNKNGDITGLGYQSTSGCFIYRRSVAKEVFGTDDPAEIQKAIGGGSGDFEKFWDAAEKCASKNVAIISDSDAMWRVVQSSAEKGWIVDGKLYIDPKREEFFEISKKLNDNGWTNNAPEWSEGWYADMNGTGDRPVLGFFGPAWFIHNNLVPSCGSTYGDWAVCNSPVGFSWGGTWLLANKNMDAKKKAAVKAILNWVTLDTSEKGLQYLWADGQISGSKDTVSSSVVMKKVHGEEEFLGGQNMFDYFVSANEYAKADIMTEFDGGIDYAFKDAVKLYATNTLHYEPALLKFKSGVADEFNLQCDDMSLTKLDFTKYSYGPKEEEYCYSYTSEARFLIDDFKIPEPGERIALTVKGKTSKDFDAPVEICLWDLNHTPSFIASDKKDIACKAGESFTTTFILDIPIGTEFYDDSDLCLDLYYEWPDFDETVDITDFEFSVAPAPITDITIRKLMIDDNPDNYYYSYANKAERLISNFDIDVAGKKFIVELSGKVSKPFAAPLIFWIANGDNPDQAMWTCKLLDLDAGESFKTVYVFNFPSNIGNIDSSRVYAEIYYDRFFDDEVNISDFSLKQIKEEDLEGDVIEYTYHVGAEEYKELFVQNYDYHVRECSKYSPENQNRFLRWMFGLNYYNQLGVYSDPKFTDPIISIAADDNTKSRDFYVKYDLMLKRSEWDDNGVIQHNYNACISFKDLGITEVPAPGSVLKLKLKGKPSCNLGGVFDADVIDVHNNGWERLCTATTREQITKDSSFEEVFAINLPDNLPKISIDDYLLNLVFYFDDASTEQEFIISDYEFTVEPEADLVTYTYHIGNGTFTKEVIKGYDALLIPEDRLWNNFGYFYNDMDFEGWYDNPDLTGSSVTSISAADNTINRDFYANYKFTITKNNWGPTSDDYGFSRSARLYGSIQDFDMPKAGGKIVIEMSGIPSETVDMPLEFKLFDWSRTKDEMVCNTHQLVTFKKDEPFKFAYVLELPSDANITDDSILYLDYVYQKDFLDKEFTISNFCLKQLDENDVLTYTYHFGLDERNCYGVKNYDYLLTSGNQNIRDLFSRNFPYYNFEYIDLYDNPEFTGAPVTKISAADNTINRDYYPAYNFTINRGDWKDETGDHYDYAGTAEFTAVSLNKLPVPGTTYKIKVSGNVSENLKGNFEIFLNNDINNEWDLINYDGVELKLSKDESFAENFEFDIPKDKVLNSLDTLLLRCRFTFADTADERDFRIYNFKVEVIE